MSRQKNQPLISLTSHQRDKLKTRLDGLVMQSGIALAFNQTQRFDEQINRYDNIVDALHTLGITIDGHKPFQVNPRPEENLPKFITQEIAE